MTAENEPPTFTIARLDLRPGDILVAKYPERLSLSQQERLRGWISERIPAGISLLILDNGADLAVLTAPAEKRPAGSCSVCGTVCGAGLGEVCRGKRPLSPPPPPPPPTGGRR